MKKYDKIYSFSLLVIFLISFAFEIKSQQINNSIYLINNNLDIITENDILNNYHTPYFNQFETIQFGNNNTINIKAETNNLFIQQNGQSNIFEFVTYYGNNDLKFEVYQTGDNNTIKVFGENSLLNNMKLYQNSSFNEIIITNF